MVKCEIRQSLHVGFCFSFFCFNVFVCVCFDHQHILINILQNWHSIPRILMQSKTWLSISITTWCISIQQTSKISNDTNNIDLVLCLSSICVRLYVIFKRNKTYGNDLHSPHFLHFLPISNFKLKFSTG